MLFNKVVDWLLSIVKHLPSDAECQKCLMGPCPQNLDLLPQRTRCLEKIIKAKKAKELAAARYHQLIGIFYDISVLYNITLDYMVL